MNQVFFTRLIYNDSQILDRANCYQLIEMETFLLFFGSLTIDFIYDNMSNIH